MDFPTRKENTLDLIFTTHPSFTQRCKPLPSIGNNDHDIVLLDVACKHVLEELKHIFNIIFEKNIVLVEENLIIGVYEGEITEDLLLVNLVICILKWVTWKTRNYIKYDKSIYREAIVITNLKNELRSNIQMMIKNPEVRNLYNIRKLQLLLDTL